MSNFCSVFLVTLFVENEKIQNYIALTNCEVNKNMAVGYLGLYRSFYLTVSGSSK